MNVNYSKTVIIHGVIVLNNNYYYNVEIKLLECFYAFIKYLKIFCSLRDLKYNIIRNYKYKMFVKTRGGKY